MGALVRNVEYYLIPVQRGTCVTSLSCKGGMVAQQGFQFNFDCYLAVLEEEKKFNIMMGSLNNSRYFRRILEVIFLTKLEQFVLNRTT